MVRVAYLGPAGTFTEKVARELFKKAEFIAILPIRNVIMAVENGKVDFGVVPIENFYNGEVRETLDSLADCKETKVVGEKAIKVIHCLGALKNHGKIKTILSKDQALEQCSRYLCRFYPDAITKATGSTKEAIDIIANEKIVDAAAIANESAIKLSSLKVLARDICPKNKTRFVVLARRKARKTGDDKSFIVIHPLIKDKPGVLSNVLGLFASFGINLEFIQSRPDGRNGYYFYIELNGHEEDENVKKALGAIKFFLDPENKFLDSIKVLGSYRNTHWKD